MKMKKPNYVSTRYFMLTNTELETYNRNNNQKNIE